MNLPISKRLLACCNFIHPGDRVADIGCDHGYLGIYLLHHGIASTVIAADVKPQPLESAKKNAHKYATAERMSFYLSDGVQEIPRDFDVLVCAGMGADTIISILDFAPWLTAGNYRLILQCQSKTHELRQYLSNYGWHIARENVLRDGRFLYTVMEVVYEPGHPLTPGQLYLSPALLMSDSPELSEFYFRAVKKLSISTGGKGALADSKEISALHELEQLSSHFSNGKELCNDDCI